MVITTNSAPIMELKTLDQKLNCRKP